MTAPPIVIPGAVPWIQRGESAIGYHSTQVVYPNDISNRALKWILTGSGYDPDENPFPGFFGPVFNVKSFGAVADFATDNYSAFAACMAKTIAAKGMMYIPPSAIPYGLSRGVQSGAIDGFQLWMYGATVKLLGDAAGNVEGRIFYFDTPATCKNIVIQGGILDGNQAAQSSSEQRSAIFLYAGQNVRIVDVTIQNTKGDGIQIHGEGNGSPCSDILISRCHFTGTQRHCISVNDAEDVTIDNVFGANSQSGGVHIEGEGSAPITRRISVLNSKFSECGLSNTTNQQACISATATVVDAERNRDIIFKNNICEDAGIVAFACHHAIIEGNVIRDVAGTGTDGVGIYVSSPFAVIKGNEIINPSQFGILGQYQTSSVVTYGKAYAQIIGNIIRNLPANAGTSEGIRINSGVGCHVKDNIIQNDNATATTIGIRLVSVSAPEPSTLNVVEGNKVFRCATAFVSSTDCTGNTWKDNKGHTNGTAEYSIVAGDTLQLPETVSADRGDNNITLITGTDETIQRLATTLTANRTVTLSATSAVKGSRFKIIRTGLGAFTVDVGGLKTIPSGVAAVVEVIHTGSAWALAGYQTL